jgi:Divergent InlB B-repeat domain/WD40-like Beta Propeller Repeat
MLLAPPGVSGVRNLRGPFRFSGGLFICLLAVLLSACQQQINFPAPTITKLDPNTMPAGSPSFPLTVTGSNLTPSSIVTFNNTSLPLFEFQSTSSITVQVPAALVQNPGKVAVTVFTPQPGGGISQPLTFTIVAGPNPIPQITSLSPSGVFTGSGSFTLSITGSNFVSQSAVNVNGSARQTVFVNATSLQVSILASDVSNAGTLQVVVVNPPPGGGTSNAFPVNVRNPVPGIASLSPTAILVGAAGTALTLSGSGYVPNSVVMINGTPRTTTFGNAGQVQAALTTADVSAAGVDQVQVVNPAPGGGTSNILTFAVNPSDSVGLPVLVDLAPDGTQASNAICGTVSACSDGTPTLATAGPSVSQTGELVAFASNSTNLVTNPANNGLSEIFLRDTCLSSTGALGGASSCVPRNFLVSLAPTGIAADGPSAEPSLDSIGAHVAYTSTASNLVNSVPVAGGTRQIYLQPTCVTSAGTVTTCSSTTPNSGAATLVSISADGQSSGNADSYNPAISPDGQYVSFVSQATNLVSPAINAVTPQVYIYGACNASQATGAGATVTLSGHASATTTADISGNYTFSGLANGSYTVTPSNAGYTFSPASQSVPVNGANISGINFTGTTVPAIYSIAGSITPASDGAGATVTLSGSANVTTTADAFGNFVFNGVFNGTYSVTPSKTGFSFGPSNQSVSVNGANVTGINFTASTQAFNLSGTVSPAAGGVNAILALSGAAIGTTIADSSGNYSFTGLANGSYTITPSNAGYSFSPVSRFANISGADITKLDFTATALTTSYTISGTISAPPSSACTQTAHLVSSPDGGTPGNGPSSQPSISSQGSYVAFTSSATNLGSSAPNPAGAQEVFVQTTCITGASGCTKSVTLVSTPDGTTPADGSSSEPSISSDGRFIAFASTATNLGVASGGIQQIYVRDTCVGVPEATPPTCTPATYLVSTADGTTPANASAEHPSINQQCTVTATGTSVCAPGQFIAFATKATNLGANVQNGVENIFSRNTCEGLPSTASCIANTFLASQPAGASPPPANGDSIVPALSGDGRMVSFISSASNLVARDSNGLPDIFLAGTLTSYNLALTLQGNASGSVTDGLGKISCTLTTGTQSGTCAASYISGLSVTLTATAASGSTFKGWGGGVTATQCPATTNTCTVTITGDIAVTASFQ